MGPTLRFDVIEANYFGATLANEYGFDVLDLHFQFRFSCNIVCRMVYTGMLSSPADYMPAAGACSAGVGSGPAKSGWEMQVELLSLISCSIKVQNTVSYDFEWVVDFCWVLEFFFFWHHSLPTKQFKSHFCLMAFLREHRNFYFLSYFCRHA